MDPLVSIQIDRDSITSGTTITTAFLLPSSSSPLDFEDLDLTTTTCTDSDISLGKEGTSFQQRRKEIFLYSRMSLFLKISFSLILLICIIHVGLPYGLTPKNDGERSGGPLSLRYSYGEDSGYENNFIRKSSANSLQLENPKIAVYLKDFAGKVIKQFNGDESVGVDELTITLPEFKVEDHLWQGKSIILECFSDSFPVLWEYFGVGNPRVQVTTYRQAPDFYNTSSYTYLSTVALAETNYRQTGEYTCKGAKEYSSSSSKVFVFVPGNKLFVTNGEINDTVMVRVNEETDHWVTLPCVVSNKDAVVKLFLHTSKGSFQQLELNPQSLTFDPKQGFSLKWNGKNAIENPWGYYICQGELVRRNGDVGKVKYEKLFVKLEAPNQESQISHSQKSVENTLKFVYNEESHSLECCSIKTNNEGRISTPRMKLYTCTSISDCYMTTSTSSMSCEDGKCTEDHSVVKVNETCVGYELPEMNEAGILECMNQDSQTREKLQFSYDTETGLVTNFSPELVRTAQILWIGREEDSKEGSQEVIYFCNPNLFFFSNGLKWAIERKNSEGNIEFLPEDSFPQRPTIKVDESKVAKVYCFAPVWDSKTEWKNTSFPVPMKA